MCNCKNYIEDIRKKEDLMVGLCLFVYQLLVSMQDIEGLFVWWLAAVCMKYPMFHSVGLLVITINFPS